MGCMKCGADPDTEAFVFDQLKAQNEQLKLQLGEVIKQRDVFALGMSPVVDALRVELREKDRFNERLRNALESISDMVDKGSSPWVAAHFALEESKTEKPKCEHVMGEWIPNAGSNAWLRFCSKCNAQQLTDDIKGRQIYCKSCDWFHGDMGCSKKLVVPQQKIEWCVCGDPKTAHQELPCTVLKPDGKGFYNPTTGELKLKPCGCTEFRQQVPGHLCLACATKLSVRVSVTWAHAGRCCLCEHDGPLYKKLVD